MAPATFAVPASSSFFTTNSAHNSPIFTLLPLWLSPKTTSCACTGPPTSATKSRASRSTSPGLRLRVSMRAVSPKGGRTGTPPQFRLSSPPRDLSLFAMQFSQGSRSSHGCWPATSQYVEPRNRLPDITRISGFASNRAFGPDRFEVGAGAGPSSTRECGCHFFVSACAWPSTNCRCAVERSRTIAHFSRLLGSSILARSLILQRDQAL